MPSQLKEDTLLSSSINFTFFCPTNSTMSHNDTSPLRIPAYTGHAGPFHRIQHVAYILLILLVQFDLRTNSGKQKPGDDIEYKLPMKISNLQ